ncbi:uncharacterized protein LOC131216589 [Anopheles bellator]|uniref:uncharacterized protein LOC131216589 n=1 Tax=Anopheles bellator TaxID=139047 RepID=UPI002648A791|nr:uncharacterized protein LOC131216589 [Anopheles bellator]
MNLNDLPDEVLCTIFDHLDLYELKLASSVCRRWSHLTFSGRRMDRVWLVIRHSNCDFLCNTKREYRNVRLTRFFMRTDHLESALPLLLTLMLHVRMLDLQCDVTTEQSRLILLEAPELQHLSMQFDLRLVLTGNCKMNGPFPVLPKLKSLVLVGSQFYFFPSKLNTPNLQCLNMSCSTDLELEAWKYFSGQLKLVRVDVLNGDFLQPLLKLTFPLLEDLSVKSVFDSVQVLMSSSVADGFFRRHPFLRRLSIITSPFIPVAWVESISQHCPELTYLNLFLESPNEGLLESLVHLKKFKHLSLEGEVYRKILRGVMTSLETVRLRMSYPEVLLKNLFEVVPQLSCLQITYRISCDELQFICERFSCLRRLELVFGYQFLEEPVADDFVRFDKLLHLQELKLSGKIKIRSIHPNNVRSLTLYSPSSIFTYSTDITNDDLYEIPEKFSLVKRLILENCSVSLDAVERLHKLMPSCRIDYEDERFYPIDDVTAD